MFSFTSDDKFNLEKISRLVLRDVQQGAFLHKNKKFVEEDFEQIKKNICQIQEINNNYDPNETLPQEIIERENNQELLQGNNYIPEQYETETEENQSMSIQVMHS